MPVGWRPFRAWGCNGVGNPALQAGLSHFALAGHPVGAKDNAGWGRATSPMGDKGRTRLRQVGSLMGAREKVGGERRVGSGVGCFLDEPCHVRGVAPIQGLGM